MVCGIDGECRDQCASERDCIPGQLCVSGSCADDVELVDGALPVSADVTDPAASSTPCQYNSDCEPPLVCRAGTCLAECRADRDCAGGALCVDGVCEGGGGTGGSGGALCVDGVCEGGALCVDGVCEGGGGTGGSGGAGGAGGGQGGSSVGGAAAGGASGGQPAGGSGGASPGSASCTDGRRNGDEADVDCGGSCPPCVSESGCTLGTDCASGLCADGRCAAPSCFDGVTNGGEAGPDCGGAACSTPCGDGVSCVTGTDCVSKVCSGGVCLAPTCADAYTNGTETDTDCGGSSCPPCPPTSSCSVHGDCDSGVCSAGACTTGSCSDGIQNRTESDVDCGGPCAPCALGKGCSGTSDCAEGICDASVCRAPVSCNELHAEQPALGDGAYYIDPDTSGPGTSFLAHCDMVGDGGGWTLVTSSLRDTAITRFATATESYDAMGGMIHSATSDTTGCNGSGNQGSVVPILDLFAWTEIRYDVEYSGAASCWAIFGREEQYHPSALGALNIVPLSIPPDTIRNQVAMGGSAGDLFDGITTRCDNEPVNSWLPANGNGVRSASVIQRRVASTSPVSLGLSVNCTGASSATWKYSNVYDGSSERPRMSGRSDSAVRGETRLEGRVFRRRRATSHDVRSVHWGSLQGTAFDLLAPSR